MPEIDILHVYRWTGRPMVGGPKPIAYTVETINGSEVQSETDEDEFGVNDLAELGAAHGVTRWAERTESDSDLTSEIVLIGWAEAPIARSDVETHTDRGTTLPAVNIKVHDTNLPTGDAFKELVEEFELDPKLAALSLDELRALIEQYIEADEEQGIFTAACEVGFESAKEDAVENCFPRYPVKVYTEGRSGGWLVVNGLPEVETWGPALLTAWHQFSALCRDEVSAIPRQMAWHVLANCQEDLAGRVVRVSLTITISNADLAHFPGDPQDPVEWDWHDMLDLSRETDIRVRKL